MAASGTPATIVKTTALLHFGNGHVFSGYPNLRTLQLRPPRGDKLAIGMNRRHFTWTVWALPLVAAAQAHDLCAVLNGEHSTAHTIDLRAVLHPTIHGTYLSTGGCEGSLLLVLPEEIPGYNGPVRTVKDRDFDRFLDARYDHRPDAPKFEATFSGVIETASGLNGFGYYRNHRVRLVLRSVIIEPKETVIISDPPMIGKRPNLCRRVWKALRNLL